MPGFVRITDVSPRDGLQNEPGVIATAEKVRLVEMLCATGVDEVEVTSFVSPRWVPQLGDGADVFAGLLRSPSQREGLGVGGGDANTTEPRWSPPARLRVTMAHARALRKAATGPEQELWSYLRQRAWMGAKFRRQHPFGPYILDFFCQEKLLAIEVDGRTHRGPQAEAHDRERDAWIAAQGVRVLRYSDDHVIQNSSRVAESIRALIVQLPSSGALKPTPQPPPSGRGSLSALVPNIQGLQALLDVNRKAGRRVVSKVAVFTAASETFSKKNTNATIAETIDRFRPVVRTALQEGLVVRGYVSCAIACPFEGPIEPSAVVGVAKSLVELGVHEIDLGDTIGAGTAASVSQLLQSYESEFSIRSGRVLCTLHLHDTFGRAAECVKAALDLGVRSFDGAVGGLGGCPYASTPGRRAPGNISTELLVKTVHEAGYETGVDLEKLGQAAEYARGIVAKARQTAQDSAP